MGYAPRQGAPRSGRTFRITAPAVAYVTRTGIRGALAFEYLCAYAALHCAALLGFRLLGARSAGFFATLLLAATYFGSAVFNAGPMP